MAKISARGATEVARYVNSYGWIYVATSDGRVLQKQPGDRYKLIRRYRSAEEAAQAAKRFAAD